MDFSMAKMLKEMGCSMNTIVNTVFDTLFQNKYGRLPLVLVEDWEHGTDEDLRTQAAEIAWKL